MFKIQLNPKASVYFQQLMAQDGTIVGFHIHVEKSGCAGWMYRIKPVTKIPEDAILSQDNPLFYTEKQWLGHVNQIQIEIVLKGLQKHVVCKHAYETSRCGCGESFTLDSSKIPSKTE